LNKKISEVKRRVASGGRGGGYNASV